MEALQLSLDSVYLKDASSSCPTTSTAADSTKCSLVNEDPRVTHDGSGEFASGVQNLNASHFNKGSDSQSSKAERHLSRSDDGASQLGSNGNPRSLPLTAYKADDSSRIDSRPSSSESQYKATENISPGLATLISCSSNGKQVSDEVTEAVDVVPRTMQKQRLPEEVAGTQEEEEEDEDDDFVLGQEALEEIELLEKESMARKDSPTRPGTWG